MKETLISPHWTGQDALVLVALLEELVAAIWQTHGHAMARELRRARLLAEVSEQDHLYADVIPF